MNPDDPDRVSNLVPSREEALALREEAVRLREQALIDCEAALARSDAGASEVTRHNEDLRLANEKLVLATLASDQLRQEALSMQRRQNEFLAMLAHELRNPLAPIRTAIEVISRFQGKPAPPPMLEMIRRQVSHMVRMLDDLLDVSRITHGKVELQCRLVSIQDVVATAVEACGHLFSARRQRFSIDVPSEPILVQGDPVRLGQVINNLLNNACKYTPEEGVVRLCASADDDHVVIRVVDSGAGISAAALKHVFDLFVQDERLLTRAEGGLGIGLTVVKRMVELHGGTVEARSGGRGTGSEFAVTLPRAEPSADVPTTDTACASPRTGARVLIVEDHIDSGYIIAELLRSYGHQVEVELDGRSALDRFARFQPDVVFCDIGLPGIDGYELAATIRARNRDPQLVLVALTGYGTQSDVERALKAGFDSHLVKPAEPVALLRIVAGSARRADPGQTPASASC